MIKLVWKIIFFVAIALPALAQSVETRLAFGENPRLDALFAEMQSESGEGAASAERETLRIFRHSGSPAMDLLLARGFAAIEAEDYETAIWHFSALIDHAPNFAEGYNARAVAYFLMGRYGESMADIKTTLALNPRHFGALAGLGSIEEDVGNLEFALKAYKAALSLNPNSAELADSVKRVEDQIFMVH